LLIEKQESIVSEPDIISIDRPENIFREPRIFVTRPQFSPEEAEEDLKSAVLAKLRKNWKP